jgi:hypothetical protein
LRPDWDTTRQTAGTIRPIIGAVFEGTAVVAGVFELSGELFPRAFPFPPGHAISVDRTQPAAIRLYPAVDHIWPRARGGTNEPVHLIAACTTINEIRGEHYAHEVGLDRLAVTNRWHGLVSSASWITFRFI